MNLFFDKGKLIWNDGKVAVSEACCCTTTTSFTCSSGTEPAVIITITAIDANLPVTWCGKTWVKSTETPGTDEAYSGQPQNICPTSYSKDTVPSGAHDWIHAAAGTTTIDLSIHRQYTGAGINAIYLNSVANYAHMSTFFGGTYYFQDPSTWSPSLGALPTASDFFITNAFFTSVTVSGVTYTWSAGSGW